MNCNKCGFNNNINNKYCINCGNLLYNANIEISFMLGIVCIISALLFNVVCFIPGIISIIYSFKYKKDSGKYGIGFGLSIGGMVYSLIILIISVFLFLALINTSPDYNTNDDTLENVNVQYNDDLIHL